MALNKISDSALSAEARYHTNLPDVPKNSADEMKEFFDYVPRRVIIPKVNEIIDEVGLKAPSDTVYTKTETEKLVYSMVPAVTADDNDKALVVRNGKWEPTAIPTVTSPSQLLRTVASADDVTEAGIYRIDDNYYCTTPINKTEYIAAEVGSQFDYSFYIEGSSQDAYDAGCTVSGTNYYLMTVKLGDGRLEEIYMRRGFEEQCTIHPEPWTWYKPIYTDSTLTEFDVTAWGTDITQGITVTDISELGKSFVRIPFYITAKAERIATFSQITDYIVEQGTQNGWTYEKYNSGVAKAWVSSSVSVELNTAMGSTGWYKPVDFVRDTGHYGIFSSITGFSLDTYIWDTSSPYSRQIVQMHKNQIAWFPCAMGEKGEVEIFYSLQLEGRWKDSE